MMSSDIDEEDYSSIDERDPKMGVPINNTTLKTVDEDNLEDTEEDLDEESSRSIPSYANMNKDSGGDKMANRRDKHR